MRFNFLNWHVSLVHLGEQKIVAVNTWLFTEFTKVRDGVPGPQKQPYDCEPWPWDLLAGTTLAPTEWLLWRGLNLWKTSWEVERPRHPWVQEGSSAGKTGETAGLRARAPQSSPLLSPSEGTYTIPWGHQQARLTNREETVGILHFLLRHWAS